MLPDARTGHRYVSGAIIDEEIVSSLDESLGEDDSHARGEVCRIDLGNWTKLDLVRRFGRQGGSVGYVQNVFRSGRIEHAPSHRVDVAFLDAGRAVKGK